MPAIRPLPLDQRWKQRLALTTRTAPEFYEEAAAVTDTPHARAIRTTFRELRASAVFCTHGVPAVVILSVEAYDRSAVIDLHAKLWNQGLAHLLLVLAGDTLRAFRWRASRAGRTTKTSTPAASPGSWMRSRKLSKSTTSSAAPNPAASGSIPSSDRKNGSTGCSWTT